MLEFFLWVIFIYFVLRLFVRYAVPFLFKRALRKFERRAAAYGAQPPHENREEGSVRIDHIPTAPSDHDPSHETIEYTDFEEITDDPQRLT